MIPMGPGWWGQSTEQDDRGQTIATLWMIGRYPLFAAGALPLDAHTLSYLVNPVALALNRREEGGGAPTSITYEGNCTCTGGAGSCTIPHGPHDHPAQPCLTKWVAHVPSPDSWTALAIINMGEDDGHTVTGFAAMGLPAQPSDHYLVRDVWTGTSLGVFAGDAVIDTPLRLHASVLLQIVPA